MTQQVNGESTAKNGLSEGGQASIVGTPISKRRVISQATQRFEIRQVIENVDALELQVRELDAEIEQSGAVAAVGYRAHLLPGLDIAIEKRAARRGRLEVFKEQRDRKEQALQASLPTQEETSARQAHQQEFARIAAERLECDRAADGLIEELRSVLTKRAELSKSMGSFVHLLDLELDADGLDTARFQSCLSSLTVETLARSRRWYDWFFGIPDGTNSYVVLDKSLEIPETFARNGLYSRGDVVQLPEWEARELLRDDRPVPGKRKETLPPSIAPLESYRQAEAEAKRLGRDVDSILFVDWYKRQAELREQAGSRLMELISKSLPTR
jgi:hypothetical protein